jgi:hypothetical protein
VAWLRFRLGYPEITELRCAGCSLTGGIEVETEDEALEVGQMLDREVRVGETISEPPCVPPHFPEQEWGTEGLACPRTVLDHDNDSAARLVMVSLNETTRPLAADLYRDMAEGLGDADRSALLDRACSALLSKDFTDARDAAIERHLAESQKKRGD